MRGPDGKHILRFKIGIVVEPDGDEFHAYCPSLKGLHVSGATQQDALQNVIETAQAWLESLIECGDPIPVDCVVIDRPPETTPRTQITYRELAVACA